MHFLDSHCLCQHLRNCPRSGHFLTDMIHLDFVNLLFFAIFLSMSSRYLYLLILLFLVHFFRMVHTLLRFQILLVVTFRHIESLCDLLDPYDLGLKDLEGCCDLLIWIFYFLASFLIKREDSLWLLLGYLLEMVYTEDKLSWNNQTKLSSRRGRCLNSLNTRDQAKSWEVLSWKEMKEFVIFSLKLKASVHASDFLSFFAQSKIKIVDQSHLIVWAKRLSSRIHQLKLSSLYKALIISTNVHLGHLFHFYVRQ